MSSTNLEKRMHALFTNGFCAYDIAEPLLIVEDISNSDVKKIQADLNGQLLFGVLREGKVSGYMVGDALSNIVEIKPDQLVSQEATYQQVISVLDHHEYCFVTFLGQVSGVITRNEMQKPSVRMWLFGMMTITEMFVVSLIETYATEARWQQYLSPGRLKKATALQNECKRRKQDRSLLNCLTVSDRFQIVIKDEKLIGFFEFESKTQAQSLVSKFESLRNNLAHGEDIVSYDWDLIVLLSGRVEKIMNRLSFDLH